MEKVLAENLKAIMHARADLRTQAMVAAKAHGAIDQTTVGRILREKYKVTMKTLAALAEATGMEPYQLLVPGLDPKNPQILKQLSQAEANLYRALEEARKPGTQ